MSNTEHKYAIFTLSLGNQITKQFFAAYPELLVDKYNAMTPDDFKEQGLVGYALAHFEHDVWGLVDGSWSSDAVRRILDSHIDEELNGETEVGASVVFMNRQLAKARVWLSSPATLEALSNLVRAAVLRNLSLVQKNAAGFFIQPTGIVGDSIKVTETGVSASADLFVDVILPIEAVVTDVNGNAETKFVDLTVSLNYYLNQFNDTSKVDIENFQHWDFDRHNMKVEVK